MLRRTLMNMEHYRINLELTNEVFWTIFGGPVLEQANLSIPTNYPVDRFMKQSPKKSASLIENVTNTSQF